LCKFPTGVLQHIKRCLARRELIEEPDGDEILAKRFKSAPSTPVKTETSFASLVQPTEAKVETAVETKVESVALPKPTKSMRLFILSSYK